MKKLKTILIVDDEKINIDILLGLLDQSYNVIPAKSGEKAFEILEKKVIDLILLDIVMPSMDGFEVCERLKNSDKTRDIPVIFITASTDEQSIEKAYDIGGADYVTKPFRPRELLSRVKKELEIQTMMSELKLLASTDFMTKLYNRRHFAKASESILDLAKRQNQNLCVAMLDIDKFKNINDIYGHKVGDEVIIEVARKLTEHQRKSDIACRYGGEEFVVLLFNTALDTAKIVSQRIRVAIEETTLLEINSKLRFTVSIGVSQINMENKNSLDDALKRADEALYKAKQSGRNKVCIIDDLTH